MQGKNGRFRFFLFRSLHGQAFDSKEMHTPPKLSGERKNTHALVFTIFSQPIPSLPIPCPLPFLFFASLSLSHFLFLPSSPFCTIPHSNSQGFFSPVSSSSFPSAPNALLWISGRRRPRLRGGRRRRRCRSRRRRPKNGREQIGRVRRRCSDCRSGLSGLSG